ncbi:MAG: hypothetical protein DWQ04_25285 [Chloroflexi bacterium]|nr:MAG: hypothetical protein DWQ04_25285 [Chloroflexota bacterium]
MRKLVWIGLLLLFVGCRGVSGGVEGETAVSPPTTFIPNQLPTGFDAQGHRGARGLKPENSLPAFETALDLGVTTLELDLHYTSDGVVVIWHDDKIENDKCGLDPNSTIETPDPDSLVKWGEALLISRLTFAQVQAYRCDRNPDPDRFPAQNNTPTPLAGDDYGIISLEELFQFVETYSTSDQKNEQQQANALQMLFNIETKRKPDSPKAINDGFDGRNAGPFELEILRLVAAFDLEDSVTIQSFDHRSLWAIRAVNDSIQLAALTSRGSADITGFAENGANIWSPNYNSLTPELVSKAHKVGLLVIPWTVNETAVMHTLIDMGVDGIISDWPDLLLELD